MHSIVLATIPALETAAMDTRLSPMEKAAILWCYHTPLLTVAEFRPLKIAAFQRGVGLRTRNAFDVHGRLVALGYLEDGYGNPLAPAEVRTLRRPRWFRLVYRVARREAA